jgi:DNA-directed RNA polymerase subunit M/transcription elongation factor TFIIS
MSVIHTILSTIFVSSKKVKAIEDMLNKQFSKDELNNVVYNIYGDYLANIPIETIEEDIKKKCLNWSSSAWNEQKHAQQELDDFITTPQTVEEGVLKCDKCGSFRTFSYTKQVRSSDEGASIFVWCANDKCGARWRIN